MRSGTLPLRRRRSLPGFVECMGGLLGLGLGLVLGLVGEGLGVGAEVC